MNKIPKVIVIGNSPNTLKNKYGSLIDSYDVVIRINKCTTKGFEENIGSKTDIWATTHLHYHKDPLNHKKIFVPEDYKNIKYLWKRTPRVYVDFNDLPKDFPKVETYTMSKNNQFIKNGFKTYSNKLNYEPCTGLLTILTSTLFYQDITIYGFSFYTESWGNITSYYRDNELKNGKHIEDKYWDNVKKIGNVSEEEGYKKQKILNELETKGLIKILN